MLVNGRSHLEPVLREIADVGKLEVRVGTEISGQVGPPVTVTDESYLHDGLLLSLTTDAASPEILGTDTH